MKGHCVGIHAVDVMDGVVEQKRLGVFVQVNVTELCDTETVENRGKARQRNVVVRELDPVPLNLAPVER